MTRTLTITVPVAAGKCQFTPAQLDTIRVHLERYNGKAVVVSFAKPKSTRSLKQNAYLWGVVYQFIAAHTGMSTEDVHDWCKDEFLPRRFVTLAGKEKEIRKTTTELTTGEFNEFVERVTAWAAQELGVSVPEPG